MPSNYNKYLEYLGHIDDTTREDMLSREAQIREEVEIQKKKNQEELNAAKAQYEKKVLEAQAAIEDEKKASAELLSQKEAALNATIASLHAEIESIKQSAQEALKEKVSQLKKEHKKTISEYEGKLNALQKEQEEMKLQYEKSKVEIRSQYEGKITELELLIKKRSFWGRIKGVFQSLFKRSSRQKHKSFKVETTKHDQAPKRPTKSTITWFPSKQDYADNKWGTIGYFLSLFGVIVCWFPFVGHLCFILCPSGLVSSLLGIRNKPNDKAKMGIVLSVISFIICCIFNSTLYQYLY